MQYVDIYDRVFVQATMTVYKSTHSFLNTNFTKILQRMSVCDALTNSQIDCVRPHDWMFDLETPYGLMHLEIVWQ